MISSRVLILGGSSEASALIQTLADEDGVTAILSLAGRTAEPRRHRVETRVGGFGGVAGLAGYLEAHEIDVLVNATHPFAARMSRNAWLACQQTGVPLIRLTRPPSSPIAADQWTEVADMRAAAEELGSRPQRVFLTIGRQELAAFAEAAHHYYLIRSIDPPVPEPALARATLILARGPFSADDEERLMREHRIDVLVAKDSGGAVAAGKLEAARRLRIPVVLVRRPAEPGPTLGSVADAVAAIRSHRRVSIPRGV